MLDNRNKKNTGTTRENSGNYDTDIYVKSKIGYEPWHDFVKTYVEEVALENNIKSSRDLLSYVEENRSAQRAMFIKDVLGNDFELVYDKASSTIPNRIARYAKALSESYLSSKGIDQGTPEGIVELALRILNPRKGDKIADFGSGVGEFCLAAAKRCPRSSVYGIDINTRLHEISKIRAELDDQEVELELGDMFQLPKDRKFDRIFSNYPFAVRLLSLQNGAEFVDELQKKIPEIKRATSSDWVFNSLIVEHLSENGKAIAIMSNGSTWNSIDQKIREYFIRKGLVETVISLPSKLFYSISIPTTMIVFSEGNTSIKMIDASNMYEKGRRFNFLSDKNIDDIVNLISADDKRARSLSFDELQNNDFVLSPSRYLETPIIIEDGVEFGSVIKRITRGAPLNASALDELMSETPTDIQYLMLSNIKNGMISEDLPYLKELDPKMDKYCIRNRNLLLSKNGAPFKVAVAEVDEGRKLLGNGNLFIIELDEDKVDPYYIKAFFDSEVGAASLKSIVVGATIPNISLESIKKLVIPVPSIEKQKEIASLYQAKQDEIKVLQLRVQKAINELKGIFGEVD